MALNFDKLKKGGRAMFPLYGGLAALVAALFLTVYTVTVLRTAVNEKAVLAESEKGRQQVARLSKKIKALEALRDSYFAEQSKEIEDLKRQVEAGTAQLVKQTEELKTAEAQLEAQVAQIRKGKGNKKKIEEAANKAKTAGLLRIAAQKSAANALAIQIETAQQVLVKKSAALTQKMGQSGMPVANPASAPVESERLPAEGEAEAAPADGESEE